MKVQITVVIETKQDVPLENIVNSVSRSIEDKILAVNQAAPQAKAVVHSCRGQLIQGDEYRVEFPTNV